MSLSNSDAKKQLQIDDYIAKLRQKDPSLRTIDLRGQSIGNEGVQWLVQTILDVDNRVKQLDLTDTNISKDGVSHVIRLVQTNPNYIKSVNLSKNKLGDDAMVLLADALTATNDTTTTNHVTTLILRDVGMSRRGMDAIGALLLSPHNRITKLDASENDFGHIRVLARALTQKHNKIMTLHLHRSKIGTERVKTLAESIQSPNCKLMALDLSHNYFGKEAVRALCEAMTFPHNVLTWLDLSFTGITNESVQYLAQAVQHRNNHITTLRIGSKRLGLSGMAALAEALRSEHNHVTTLDVSLNSSGITGAELLAETLVSPSNQITSLDLSNTALGPEGCRLIAACLVSPHNNITTLLLDSNGIGNEGVQALSEALVSKDHNLLFRLDLLGYQGIDDDGAVYMARALQSRYCKTVINMDLDGLSASLAEMILGLMAENRVIQTHWKLQNRQQRRGLGLFLRLNGASLEWRGEHIWNCHVEDGIGKAFLAFERALYGLWGDRLPPRSGRKLYDACKANNFKALRQLIHKATSKEGIPLLHVLATKTHPVAYSVCRLLVERVGCNLDQMDRKGRTARQIAVSNMHNEKMSEWARSIGLFLNSYQLDGMIETTSPVYHCDAFSYYEATDTQPGDDQLVTIKIVHDENTFQRELRARLGEGSAQWNNQDVSDKSRFGKEYIVPMLRYHDTLHQNQRVHSIVLSRPSQNLSQIMDSEYISGRDLERIREIAIEMARALQHIHAKNYIHGNVKPRSLVRHDHFIKFMDMGSITAIGEEIDSPVTSGYVPPEVARAGLFRDEDIPALEQSLQERLVERKRLVATDQDIALISHEINVLQTKINIRQDVESSFTSLIAAPTMDVWGYGLIMYELFTGARLFRCDVEDNLLDSAEELRFMSWIGLYDELLLRKVLARCDDASDEERLAAQEFLQLCLEVDPERRFQDGDDILGHPFLGSSSQSRTKLKIDVGQNMDLLNEIRAKLEPHVDSLVKLDDVDNPYLYQFITDTDFEAFQENLKEGDGTDIELEFTKAIDRAKTLLANAKGPVSEFCSSDDGGVGGSKLGRALSMLSRAKPDVMYLQLLCGLTLKPVVSYKVKKTDSAKRIQHAAGLASQLSWIGIATALLWQTQGASPKVFGFPVEEIPTELLEKARDFVLNVQNDDTESVAGFTQATGFTEDARSVRPGDHIDAAFGPPKRHDLPPTSSAESDDSDDETVNQEDLDELGIFLEELQTGKRMRHLLDETDKSSLNDGDSAKTWSDGLSQTWLSLEGEKYPYVFYSVKEDEAGHAI